MNSRADGTAGQSCRGAACGTSCGPSSRSRSSHGGVPNCSTVFRTLEEDEPVAPQFSVEEEFRLEYKRLTTAYSTSLVLLKMSRSSKRKILEKLSIPDTLR